MSRAVKALIEKGLVRRRPGDGEPRRALLEPTERGRSLYRALLPQLAAINQRLMMVLSDAEARKQEGLPHGT